MATGTSMRGARALHSGGLRSVVITGIGLVTPLGIGREVTWNRIIAGETGVRALTPEDLPEAHRHCFDSLPSKVVACVPPPGPDLPAWFLAPDERRHARCTTLARWAAAEALADAGWRPETDAEHDRTGVAIGVGMSFATDLAEAGVLVAENRLRRLSPHLVPRILTNSAAGAVGLDHGLRGPTHCVATACATGAHALGDAARLVALGDADAMLAGGAESCVDAVALAGFGRMKALSTRYNGVPAAAAQPFDAGRDGFVLGEGAGVVLLEEESAARARGARIYARLAGYGLSGDAHHATQPPPDGDGARRAMAAALRGAGLAPTDVAYLNAHATSTPQGDEAEARAVAVLFGGRGGAAPSAPPTLLVSSTKGATGHLLGGAGAVEAALATLALARGVAPPTLNLERAEPAGLLPGLVGPQARELPRDARATMSNSFGFGGTNATLVFTAPVND